MTPVDLPCLAVSVLRLPTRPLATVRAYKLPLSQPEAPVLNDADRFRPHAACPHAYLRELAGAKPGAPERPTRRPSWYQRRDRIGQANECRRLCSSSAKWLSTLCFLIHILRDQWLRCRCVQKRTIPKSYACLLHGMCMPYAYPTQPVHLG